MKNQKDYISIPQTLSINPNSIVKPLFFVVALFINTSCDKGNVAPPVTTFPLSKTWWNDDVFYEVFVRSFYDVNGDGIGDFQGLIQKLDYLNDGDSTTDTDLGITAIWLMPIYPSPSYHGYDVTNFRDVNPQYGTLNEFRVLISEAHKRGIKIILDFEITDTSDQHPWFVNSASSSTSEKRDWYVWSVNNPGYVGPWGQNVWNEKNDGYYYSFFGPGLPHLNFKNNEVTGEIEDITRFWHQETGVDGFRMDAALLMIEEGAVQSHTESTLNWWRDYYLFQKKLDPALMTVGEVWESTAIISPFADHRLDYCFEFNLASAIIDAVQNGNVVGLTSKMEEVLNSYAALQYGTFLTNHDQNRVIENLGLDFNKAKAAAGILLSLPGIPYLYYGEEVGMRGVKPDEDLRRPMQWSNGFGAGFTNGIPWRGVNPDYVTSNVLTMKSDPGSLWNHYRKLIHIRTGSNPLKHGSYERVSSSADKIFSFLRVKDGEAVLAIHNLQASANQGVQFSMASSSLPSGDYAVKDLLLKTDLGTLTVGDNGGFSFSPLVSVEPFSTSLLSLKK